MIKLRIRYTFVEKGGVIFVKLPFKLPKELALIVKKELTKRFNKDVIFTPFVQQGTQDCIEIEID